MELDQLFKDRVRERDLDNFLIEELQASEDFRKWFFAKLPESFHVPLDLDVRVQKSPKRLQDARQTDVRIGWFDPTDTLCACVLIESKVTADFQPSQAESYFDEVQAHRKSLGSANACSVLVAPREKFSSLAGAALFDSMIAIEEMAEFLTHRRISSALVPELDARLATRTSLLMALAGKRATESWVPVTVESKRNFAVAYSDLAKLIIPNLTVRASTDGPKALTRFFDGLEGLPNFPCGVKLKHEFGNGRGMKYANLQFDGQADKETLLADLIASEEEEWIYPEISGKALFARVNTPGLVPDADQFDTQRAKVIEGLRAVGQLADWFTKNRGRLAQSFSTPVHVGDASDNLNKRFEGELRRLAATAIAECKYRPGYFLDMLEQRGAVATTHALLMGKPSDGFTRLWELGRLDLTLEAVVIEEPWCQLFSEGELAIARRRLDQAGYKKRS